MSFSRTPADARTADSHQDQLADLSAYLLGGLASSQAEGVSRHVGGCPICQAELPLLQETVTMLDAVPPEALLDGPPEDADLLVRRTLRRLREQEAREVPPQATNQARWLAVAAALVVLAGIGGLALGRGTTGPSNQAGPTVTVTSTPTPVPGTKVATNVDPGTGARLTVTVAPAKGWVRVNAVAAGIAAGQKCHLIVVAKDGSRIEAGSWLVSAAGAARGTTLDGAALVELSQVSAVRVETSAGQLLVSTPVV